MLVGTYQKVVRMGWVGPTRLAFVSVDMDGREAPFVVDMTTLGYERKSVPMQRFPELFDSAAGASEP